VAVAENAGMLEHTCGCRYKIITVDPLGLSAKPSCSDGRAAHRKGPDEMARHLGLGYALRVQEAARARDAAETSQDVPDAPVGPFALRADIFSETFAYTLHDHSGLVYEWDVVAAQQRANGREILMELTQALFPLIGEGTGEVDWDRVRQEVGINPDLPLIVIPLPWPPLAGGGVQHVIIDGWHRLARAGLLGKPEVPIVILTADDERAIRLRPSQERLEAAIAEEVMTRK
jgi:CheY-like chemotaxis protein